MKQALSTSLGAQTAVGGLSGATVTIGNVANIAHHNQILGVSPNGSLNWQNLSFDNDPVPLHVKKYTVLEIEEDLLVLSVVWQRLRNEKKSQPLGISTVLDRTLLDNVTQDDRVRAESIRDYYSKKFTVWSLNGMKLSNFREDLKIFIHSDGKIFTENMRPLVYRLPEFYDYDIEFDNMFSEHNMKVSRHGLNDKITKKLTFTKKLIKRTRLNTMHEYWFTDEFDNLNLLSLRKETPLLSLLDLCIREPIVIETKLLTKVRDNREYNLIENYYKFV
jgi:hypothetical protein